MAENRTKIAIVGGGIAGLALAAGLAKKPHIDLHVYEAVPAYKDVGAGLALHLNAIKAMSLLGPELRQAYFDKAAAMGEEDQEMVTEVILAHGPHTGQLVAELGRAKGRKTISRADLLDGFLALIPRDRISFGKRLASISEEASGRRKVTLTFEDGTNAEADCLLGGDGVHSVTRAYLLGEHHPATPPQNHDGWQIYRTMVPTAEARKQIDPKWTTRVPILLGPRGHINCIPLNRNTRLSAGVAVRGAALSSLPSASLSSVSAQNGSSSSTGSTGTQPLDPSLYADYSEEAQEIVRLVAKDTSASWTAMDHDHAPFYARGRVAMFGDAAHTSMPFAGNGAAQALEDAAVLDCLFGHMTGTGTGTAGGGGRGGEGQIERALRAFDEVRRPRSQAVVDLARKFGRVYAFAEDGMHEDPVRMKAFFAEMAAFTNEFDVKGQNEEALRVFERLGGVDGSLKN